MKNDESQIEQKITDAKLLRSFWEKFSQLKFTADRVNLLNANRKMLFRTLKDVRVDAQWADFKTGEFTWGVSYNFERCAGNGHVYAVRNEWRTILGSQLLHTHKCNWKELFLKLALYLAWMKDLPKMGVTGQRIQEIRMTEDLRRAIPEQTFVLAI